MRVTNRPLLYAPPLRVVALACLLVAAITGVAAPAPDPAAAFIDALFWEPLDVVPGTLRSGEPGVVSVPEPPAPTEEVARRLLERARAVFSALTFGYRFRYAPGDGRRGIREEFELQPVAEFAWGDARLQVLDTYVRDNLLYSQLRYELSAAEQAHRSAWASNRIPLVGGTGTGNRFLGEEGRREALEAAVRSAIRDHLSAQISKPREIRGDLLIWQPPATVEDAGRYHTTVQVKLFVTNVVPHRVY